MILVRRIIHILLLFCLPLYGFAMQGGLPRDGGGASLAHQLEHKIEHDQGIHHHHHEEDGSVHYDESDESRDHAQEHSSTSQPAGFGLARMTFPPEQSVSELGAYIAHSVPEPFLDGPHRPPASTPAKLPGA